MRPLIFAILGALVCGLALGCSEDGPTAIELPIASLEITNPRICLGRVIEAQCQFEVEARTAEGQLITNPVVRWFSNNSSVASVDSRGLVEARSAGQATITVSSTSGNVTDTADVLVLPSNPK